VTRHDPNRASTLDPADTGVTRRDHSRPSQPATLGPGDASVTRRDHGQTGGADGDGDQRDDVGAAPISRANLEDLAEILALQRLAFRSEAELVSDFTIQPLRQTLDEMTAEYRESVILKAEWAGRIVGSIRARATAGTARISKLMVHPDHQGRGLGSRLLAAIEAEFPGHRLELFTSNLSAGNLRLYEAKGYRRFRQEATSRGFALVFMEKHRE